MSVLRLIQGRGKWNAKAIAEELEVTERTVYRDLQALEFAGVPWYFDEVEQSYRVRSGYRFPVPNLTEEEVIGQAVATAITKASGLDIAGNSSATTHKIAASANDDTKQLLADIEQVVCVLGRQRRPVAFRQRPQCYGGLAPVPARRDRSHPTKTGP